MVSLPQVACRAVASLLLGATVAGTANTQVLIPWLQDRVRVVNVVPLAQSNETGQDAEPNIAVNPADANQIVVSAFTTPVGLCGVGSNTAPIYVSTDRGASWSSGRWPTADVVSRAAETPAIRTEGSKRILISSSPEVLTWANQPCDEKAVGTVVTWR